MRPVTPPRCQHPAGIIGLLLIALFGALVRPELLAAPATDVRTNLEFAVIGDVRLTLDTYVPQEGPAPFPTIVWVHGGGFVSGDKKEFPRTLLDPILASGFAMVSVNYRLAPKHPFPACVDDVEAAIAFIKAHARSWKLDPDKLILMGESAGGLIVSVVGGRARPENRVAGVVSLFGEHDLVTRVQENPCIMDGRAEPMPAGGCLSPGLKALLNITAATQEAMPIVQAASAVSYVRKDMPPYLLIHGTREFHVPYEQAVSMHDRMKRKGADCTLLSILGGSHGTGGWEKLPQAREYKEETLAWLRTKLRLQP
ncbi:MAG: alpha/beta hydrolase [Verrucomicrobia bacterium]|nr:alpha/beta hydrolase [Verrucomicrobiota bacterium]